MLMDVPGYGFAQAPGKWRSKFVPFCFQYQYTFCYIEKTLYRWGRMERSLMEQRELSAVLLLIDSKRGIDKLDKVCFICAIITFVLNLF